MAANYRVLGVTPLDAPLMGSNTIHGLTDQKTVSQHPDRFWMLTYFNDSYWFRRAFDMRLIGLASLSNYLSIHIWIIKNGVRMWPGHPFYYTLVLEPEMDSNSSWTGPPAWLGSNVGTSAPYNHCSYSKVPCPHHKKTLKDMQGLFCGAGWIA